MDYSTLPNDPDHPSGASPWSTSPEANRGTFPASTAAEDTSEPLLRAEGHSHSETDHDTLGPGAFAEQQGSLDPPVEDGSEDPGRSSRDQGARGGQPQEDPSNPHRHHQQNQGQRPGADRQPSHTKGAGRANVPKYKLQAKITGLERTGRKDPILRFDVHVVSYKTNLPHFRTTQFRDVRRTHSEFVKLADYLISANPEALVPAVPPPVTAAGAGTDEDEARVKGSLQRWLNCVCGNDVLMRDEETRFFVESDFGYSPVVRLKQPATGVRRKVIKQFAPPPDDSPELQEARPIVKLFYLGTMETGQRVDRLVRARRGLGLAESDLGVKFGAVTTQETHAGLGNAYRKLGKIIQTTGDYHAAQGTAEATTLGDPLQYHSSDALIVKETLTNRHILLRELIQAQQATRSRLSAADRLKASSSVKRDKVDEAINALDEARTTEKHLRQKSQQVTANLLQEQRRWFARTTADLRHSLREYVIREIEAERRTLATLESVRPDIRAIDASGGLSRLGREAHPATRRAHMASSQGPKGDAWSGVPRRPDGLNRSISGSFSGAAEGTAAAPNGDDEAGAGGARGSGSGSGSGPGLKGLKEEDDEDRVDARNAASRLATSTF
ncbi:MAG: Vacuolar protein sorting-associated protein 17 [Sclerophora amabilis]|nr:MAG: Vacuolar protein sorting-associated protein 17 [Sclerophora amabilis]